MISLFPDQIEFVDAIRQEIKKRLSLRVGCGVYRVWQDHR